MTRLRCFRKKILKIPQCVLITQFGHVERPWSKFFSGISVKFTLIFFHECVQSIIPRQHM